LTSGQHRGNHDAWPCQHISKHGGENIPNAGVSAAPRSWIPSRRKSRAAIDWFQRQFLKLADKATSTKERGEFLKLAFMATLKGESAFASDEAMAQCREQVEGAAPRFNEGRARWQKEKQGERDS
jgi:hypothetical protein